MAVKLLQANLHATQTQHLFWQSLCERGIGLTIVTEPHHISNSSDWTGDNNGSAAIVRADAESPLSN